jgi:hypothetical protein
VWAALSCTADSATLGSSGAASVWRDFKNAPLANTWYSAALANALSGTDLDAASDAPQEIDARFNVNLGQPGCLDGVPFYLGLDNQHGDSAIDLVTVLQHEFAHGLGFQTFTSGFSGTQFSDAPSVWDHYLYDTVAGKLWKDMSNDERGTSAVSGSLVWNGPRVREAVPSVLVPGVPMLRIEAPTAVAGRYPIGTATFGPALANPPLSGEVIPLIDTAGNIGLACNPLSPQMMAALGGRIALIDRGSCLFITKVKNVQDAGAIGVLIVDNVPGGPPPGLGGVDPTITIPAVRLTNADGLALKHELLTRSRLRTGMIATLGLDLTIRAGADAANRPFMFAPNPYIFGSSISHWDLAAVPSLLMEPAINPDLTHEIAPPFDLTLPLLLDIGWKP